VPLSPSSLPPLGEGTNQKWSPTPPPRPVGARGNQKGVKHSNDKGEPRSNAENAFAPELQSPTKRYPFSPPKCRSPLTPSVGRPHRPCGVRHTELSASMGTTCPQTRRMDLIVSAEGELFSRPVRQGRSPGRRRA
jgi:hypothetical protein